MNEPSSAWSQNEHTGLLPLTSWTFKESACICAHRKIFTHILHLLIALPGFSERLSQLVGLNFPLS